MNILRLGSGGGGRLLSGRAGGQLTLKIRLNPYISEVWYDLGTLYESCNNQIADALDAYGRRDIG
jgi:hypothetical protein